MTRKIAAAGPALVALALVVAITGCDPDDRRSSVVERREASVVALAPQKSIRISTRSADVRVIQSADDSLRVLTEKRVQSISERSAENLMSEIRVTMERDGDALVLRVREPERGDRVNVRVGAWKARRSVDITLTVAVPHGVPVHYETQRGDLEIEDVDVPLTLQSTSGDMELTNVRGTTHARSTSGDVVIREAAGAVTVQATSGDVSAVGVTGPLTVRATSGDVKASQVSGMIRVETSSGDVEVLDVAGGAQITTSTGDVTARVGGDSLVVETSSGEIDTRALGAPSVTRLRSSSGDILLKIKPNVGGQLEVETASGGMKVRNPLQVESMDRNRLTGRLGGTGVVMIRTSSGNITVNPSDWENDQ